MTDAMLHTTDLLLVTLIVVCVLQLLVLLGYGIAGYRAWQRIQREVAEIGRRQIAPLADQMSAVLADVRLATTRVNSQIDRVEGVVDGAVHHLDRAAAVVRTALWVRAWPVLAITRGVRTAMGALRHSSSVYARR